MNRHLWGGLILLFLTGCEGNKAVSEALRAPRAFLYSRDDVQIPILSKETRHGSGLTTLLRGVIIETLDALPIDHIRALQKISALAINLGDVDVNGVHLAKAGIYDPDLKAIVLDSSQADFAHPIDAQRVLLHEVGHSVQYQILNDDEKAEWNVLHTLSRQPEDFVSDYARQGTSGPLLSGEDFAETYEEWTHHSYGLAYKAFESLQENGRSVLLQKYLFMAALFATPDGTIKTYHTETRPDGKVDIRVDEEPYYRTADAITFGGYTYHLRGRTIVSISYRDGPLLTGGLSIRLPQMVFDRLALTGPPPEPVKQEADSLQDNAVDEEPVMMDTTMQVISNKSPNTYVPLTSEAGQNTITAHKAMLEDPTQQPTVQDMIRSHGQFTASK